MDGHVMQTESRWKNEKSQEWLTPRQAAELLQVSLPTLWRWRKRGLVRPVTVGRIVRYRREELARWPPPEARGARETPPSRRAGKRQRQEQENKSQSKRKGKGKGT